MQTDDILGRLLAADSYAESKPAPSKAEPRSCDHWTSPVLLERVAYLRKLARASEGSASDTIKSFPGYSAELWVRLRTGAPELHEHVNVLLMALDGRASLVTGGALEQQKRIAPGEWTGKTIAGGQTVELRAGDVVHVAAGVPHQLVVTAEKGFSCLALRMRVVEEP